MPKDKSKKGVPNKHLHSRIHFLHQASGYLTEQSLNQGGRINRASELATVSNIEDAANPSIQCGSAPETITVRRCQDTFHHLPSGLPLSLTSQLRAVAHKGQIRLTKDMKHSMCKLCNSPLIEGSTCTTFSENRSKGGRKPWAEVSVVECLACGATKRFPVAAKLQTRKALRGSNDGEKQTGTVVNAGEMPQNSDMKYF